MKEELLHIAGEFILLLIGGLISSATWITKAMIKVRRDLDSAHNKIRLLEHQLKCKETK